MPPIYFEMLYAVSREAQDCADVDFDFRYHGHVLVNGMIIYSPMSSKQAISYRRDGAHFDISIFLSSPARRAQRRRTVTK